MIVCQYSLALERFEYMLKYVPFLVMLYNMDSMYRLSKVKSTILTCSLTVSTMCYHSNLCQPVPSDSRQRASAAP